MDGDWVRELRRFGMEGGWIRFLALGVGGEG